jgi:hypothetical protein
MVGEVDVAVVMLLELQIAIEFLTAILAGSSHFRLWRGTNWVGVRHKL